MMIVIVLMAEQLKVPTIIVMIVIPGMTMRMTAWPWCSRRTPAPGGPTPRSGSTARTPRKGDSYDSYVQNSVLLGLSEFLIRRRKGYGMHLGVE